MTPNTPQAPDLPADPKPTKCGYYWYNNVPLCAGQWRLVEVYRPCWVDSARQDLAWRYLDRSCPEEGDSHHLVNCTGRFIAVNEPGSPLWPAAPADASPITTDQAVMVLKMGAPELLYSAAPVNKEFSSNPHDHGMVQIGEVPGMPGMGIWAPADQGGKPGTCRKCNRGVSLCACLEPDFPALAADQGGDFEAKVEAFLSEKMCCSGADCGCMGVTRLQRYVQEEVGTKIDALRTERDELHGLLEEAEPVVAAFARHNAPYYSAMQDATKDPLGATSLLARIKATLNPSKK